MLCGGASSRMGRDKALLEVHGEAMAARGARALRAAGCAEVLAVGGDGPALRALGLRPVADRWPGEGPLAGLASALGAVDPGALVVVAPCDLVAPDASVAAALLGALQDAPHLDAAVAEVDGRPNWTCSAWRARGPLTAAVTGLVQGGARRLGAVAAVARSRAVAGLDPDALRDADGPDELAGPGPR